ncbi:MAG: hypothetical protein L0Z53_09820 [Acidobacteriales bacterium]|nr:hypothetical protein [Terriglobales bacterium]
MAVVFDARQETAGLNQIVKANPNVAHIVLAFHERGAVTDVLNRRKQQADQNCYDRNHDEQFKKSEPVAHCHASSQPLLLVASQLSTIHSPLPVQVNISKRE